jgi:predicted nucleic acid-binding protein
MILVDTSVWIDHFRRRLPALVRLLEDGEVVLHPFIVGEVALGHLKGRSNTVALLGELPSLAAADHAQALDFAGRHGLAGSGIGWVAAHLLCAASAGGVPIWTHDRNLRKQAARMGLLHSEG